MSHYALLGVEAGSDAAQIRAAFRKQAVKLSPDREPERFARLQAAYEVLADATRRAAYDAELESTNVDGAESFAERFRGGAFAQSGDMAATADAALTGDAFGGKGLMGQLEPSVAQAIVPVSNNKGTLMETSYKLTHTEGFDAYLRNQGKNAGQVLTGDEMVKRGMIPATGSVDTVLPVLETEAVAHSSFGDPQTVLRVHRVALPDRCAHGQVLVRMLASPLNDEDFMRIRAPLEALNVLQPFCRKQHETGVNNNWEATPPGGGGPDKRAPFCGGADGVGVVMAASKHGDNVRGSDVLPKDWGSQPKDARGLAGRKDFFGPLDWVVVLPSARGAPLGTWRRLLVCHEDCLLRVTPALMPLSSLALHRVFCTAWRLLEDYGALRSGDTVIFNAADEPVGCVLLQLCRLLQLTAICVVADTPAFGATAARLKSKYGAMHVLRDNATLRTAVAQTALSQPRLALDAMGGAAGDRLLSVIRGGCPLVVYGLRSMELPHLSAASRPPYAAPGSFGAGSIHGFVLGEWVELHGPKAYLHMLESVAELVENGQLSLDGETDLLPCGTTPTAHTADTEATTAKLPSRFNATPLDAQKSGGAVVSSLEPQPVLTGDEMVQCGLIPSFQDGNAASVTKVDGAGKGMVAEKIADAVLNAVRGVVAHEVQETGVWAERRKVVLTFGTAEEAADEAVELGRAITELAQTLEWHGTKPYRPGEGPPPESEPEGEPESEQNADDEDEVEEVASLAANERARRVDALLESNSSSGELDQGAAEPEDFEPPVAVTEPEPESEHSPEPASASGKLLSETLRQLEFIDKYGEMLLGDPAVAEEVMTAAQDNGDRDALRQALKAHGVKKLGHREKLVAALYVAPSSVNGAGEAPTRLGEINIS